MTYHVEDGKEPWTVKDFRDMLAEYPQDAPIFITRYPSVRAFVVRFLWFFPFLDYWAERHDLDLFPSATPDAIWTDGKHVEIG